MPITFKVNHRFIADDERTRLDPTAKEVEYRSRYQIAIAPDARFRGQPWRLQVIVPFQRCKPWPKGPSPQKGDPDYDDWKAKWDGANEVYRQHSEGASLVAHCIADFLDHAADGEVPLPDPRLQAYLKGIVGK